MFSYCLELKMEMTLIEVMTVLLCLTMCSSNEDGQCSNIGYFGSHCQHRCSENCADSSCQKKNGTCINGCKDGFFGNTCEKGCNSKCRHRKCDRKSGECSEGCSVGHYFDDCLLECSPNCRHYLCKRDTGDCSLGCKDGYYGGQCQYSCPNCCICSRVNGTCLIDKCKKDPCFTLMVTFGSLGLFLLCLVTSAIIYRLYKWYVCREEITESNPEVSRSHVKVPELPKSPRNDSHYDVGDYYNTRKHMSRSLDSMDKPSAIHVYKVIAE